MAHSLSDPCVQIGLPAPLPGRLADYQRLRLCGPELYRLAITAVLRCAFNSAFPVLFGELAVVLWLVIKGAKPKPSVVPASSAAGGEAALAGVWQIQSNQGMKMTITTVDESQRKAANVAGFTYLFTLPFVVFANFAIHDRLIVASNAAETARNILAHER